MHKRINITLPEETLRLLEKHVQKGDRSALIDEALRRFLDEKHRAKLRLELAEGYRRNRRINRELSEEWRPLEEKAWQGKGR